MTSVAETYDPIIDNMIVSALARTANALQPGQFFTIRLRYPKTDTGHTPTVAVTNYGHETRLIEIRDLRGIPAELSWPDDNTMSELSERGFTAPTDCPRLVGDPRAWQRPFRQQWAGVAAHQLRWLLEVLQQQPGGQDGVIAEGGNLTPNGPVPSLDILDRHFGHLNRARALT